METSSTLQTNILKLSENSFIQIYKSPQYILNYIKNNFEDMFDLHPIYDNDKKSKIMQFNKDSNNPEWYELEINRWFKSYLQTPSFDNKYKKSYMFSGKEQLEISEDLPDLIKPIFNYVKNIDNRYNQVVVNWYEKENDYIALHSDWVDNMVDNYNIGILNLYGQTDKIRTLDIINKNTLEKTSIELNNGDLVLLCGDFQNEFRHGIPKLSDDDIISRRIGISFRQYK
jgi:alkylated DNA repair dioxygenase AlkB